MPFHGGDVLVARIHKVMMTFLQPCVSYNSFPTRKNVWLLQFPLLMDLPTYDLLIARGSKIIETT
jgi:hypothetical protein